MRLLLGFLLGALLVIGGASVAQIAVLDAILALPGILLIAYIIWRC